ncbi:hypothetical protein WICPIJ_007324 [Wickerhamomyces pijperi]|uniref:Zn(2)-C6 fungal-type domain-containing protein n=1 Tax=Wickerhamomyces pijperi TaxID=599730 RepID=A0A9P8Q017_WICPI|nr:hypothetical protein WICPIJ_007324 [Wickerhamomyces pijperi]
MNNGMPPSSLDVLASTSMNPIINTQQNTNAATAAVAEPQDSTTSSPASESKSIYKRTRILHACDICRNRKLKCDGIDPCSRCTKIGAKCEYSPVEKKIKQPASSAAKKGPEGANGGVTKPRKSKKAQNKEKVAVALDGAMNDKVTGPGTATASSNGSFLNMQHIISSNTQQPPPPLPPQHIRSTAPISSPTIYHQPAFNTAADVNATATLDARMSKLEGLMTLLINKLSPSSPLSFAKTDESPINTPRSSTCSTNIHPPVMTDRSNSFISHETSTTSSETATTHTTATSTTTTTATTTPPSTRKKSAEPSPKYCGSQSSLSILSPKGMIWLARKARDPSMLHQFQSMHRSTGKVYFDNVQTWVEPIPSSQILGFPPREEAVKLIEIVFEESSDGLYPHTLKEVFAILDVYYEADINQLSNSELLGLNSYLAIGALLTISNELSEDVEKYMALQEGHFLNAVHYYHRLTILSEGIKTIQGIMVLIMYCEFATAPPNNLMLITTVVRYAQDLGLHREESYYGLSEEEQLKRRKLWYHVYLFDRDFCLKSGKPPIIHDSDISCLEYDPFSSVTTPMLGVDFLNDPDIDITTAEKLAQLPTCIGPYLDSIIKIEVFRSYSIFRRFISLSYEELFSANALKDCTMNDITAKIERLRLAYEATLSELPYSLRPGTNNINWKLFDDKLYQTVKMMHLHCYLHKMNITRMAFRRAWLEEEEHVPNTDKNISEAQQGWMEESLDCARKMLEIFSQMSSNSKACFNHNAFLFFSAFFTLLSGSLEYPGGLKKEDVLLMKCAVQIYFDRLTKTSASFNDKKVYNTTSYFLRFFVKVAIDIYNIRCSTIVDRIDGTAFFNELKLFESVFHVDGEHDPSFYSTGVRQSYLTTEPGNRNTTTTNHIPYDPVRHARVQDPPNGLHQICPISQSYSNGNSMVTNSIPVTNNIGSIAGQNDFMNTPRESLFDDLQFLNDFQSNFETNGLNNHQPGMANVNGNQNLFQQVFGIPSLYLNFDDSSADGTQTGAV